MAGYYVFYGKQLHSEYSRASDYWNANSKGDIPDGSYRYCINDDSWTYVQDRGISSVHIQDVPPLLRAMALMLGD